MKIRGIKIIEKKKRYRVDGVSSTVIASDIFQLEAWSIFLFYGEHF